MILTILKVLATIFAGLVAIFLLWLIKFETSRRRRMLKKLPSLTPNYFILGNALHFLGPRDESYMRTMRETIHLAQTTPLIALWLGPISRVSVVRPEAVEMLLSGTKWLDKAIQYKFLHPWLGFGLLTSTGEKWHKRRKLITPTFHFRILEDFLPIFHEQSEIMVSLIKEKKEAFDVYPYLLRCTLDIICETAMGTSVKAQGHLDSEYVKAVNFMGQIWNLRSMNPVYFVDFIFALSSYGRQAKMHLKTLHGFTYKVIKERRAELNETNELVERKDDADNAAMGIKKRVAFLDMLLGATVDGKPLSDEDIREEVDTFMFEGHDTTSSGVAWVLYNLGRFPEFQEKVVEELRSLDLMETDRHASTEEIKKLKFLDCFIKESMRLFPPVPFYGRDVTTDTDICGYKIPAGVPFTVNTYVLHRNPEQFPDPEKFDPDRFLPEIAALRHPYAYVPFSAGPRNCIGQKFALLEEKVLVIHMIRNFKITAIHKFEEMKMSAELILRPSNGVWLTFEKRQ